MYLSVVGVNHTTAPIGILEKAAIRVGRLHDSLSLLHSYVAPAIILSTCNRTEVYTAEGDRRPAEKASLDFLRRHLSLPPAVLRQYTYIYQSGAAVEHLFRIACGLESMVVGEFEVLGQVRQALEAAEKAGMTNLPLRHVFQSAIRTGRRVREETGISRNALSISSVAVDLAARVVDRLEKSKMLVIGAGEAGRLVAKAAKDRGVCRILVASRTRERASILTEAMGGTPVSLNNLVKELNTCDIVVACADAPHWVLDRCQVEAVMKNRPDLPLVIIDIAVPRNVEPTVAQIGNVFLYNIDDLNQISETNRRQRQSEIQKAEEIIAAEAAKVVSWWRALETRPVVRALMSKAEEIRRMQLNQTLKKLRPLSDEERDNLEAMTKSIVTKILQGPMQQLKANGDSNGDVIKMVRQLFQLDTEGENEENQNCHRFPGQQTRPDSG